MTSVFPAVGITWGKVVSMYAVAGALAVDCVRQGHPTTVHILVDSLGQFVRKCLVPWLKRRGGWVRGCCCVCADTPGELEDMMLEIFFSPDFCMIHTAVPVVSNW